jgi:hypothetical protein
MFTGETESAYFNRRRGKSAYAHENGRLGALKKAGCQCRQFGAAFI